MSAWFFMRGDCLVPADEAALRGVRRMGEGECVEVTIVRPRSVAWHRMYKGICATIGENQDPPRDGDSIDYELRVLAGHYDVMHGDGFEIRVPKRIAFAKLSSDKWRNLWPSLELAIRQKWGEEYIREARRNGGALNG